MAQSESIKNLAAAIVKVQGAITDPIKNRTGSTGNRLYKYVDLPAVMEIVRPLLVENGIALFQSTEVTTEGSHLFLRTMLLHTSGEWIDGLYSVAPFGADPQKVGAAMTYARRYALSAMLGIVADEDDDAQGVTYQDDGENPLAKAKRVTAERIRTTGSALPPKRTREEISAATTAKHEEQRNFEGALAGVASFQELTELGDKWARHLKMNAVAAEQFERKTEELKAEQSSQGIDDPEEYFQFAKEALMGCRTGIDLKHYWQGDKEIRERLLTPEQIEELDKIGGARLAEIRANNRA